MNRIAREFITAAKQAPAIYFAPLRGAIQGLKDEWRRIQCQR